MYESPNEIIRRVGVFLREPIPEVDIEDHLSGLEALRFDLAEATVDWQRLLAEKKNQMLHPKDKELTDMDRKVMLNASIAVIERDYEFLLRLEGLVSDRLDLGKMFLERC